MQEEQKKEKLKTCLGFCGINNDVPIFIFSFWE